MEAEPLLLAPVAGTAAAAPMKPRLLVLNAAIGPVLAVGITALTMKAEEDTPVCCDCGCGEEEEEGGDEQGDV